MDFGFASLLDKFEEHYGRRAGKVLVGLIGMAVTSVCLGLIWGFVQPFYSWVTESAEGRSALWFVWRGLSALAAIAVLIFAGVAVSSALDARQMVRKSEDVMAEAYSTFEEVMRVLERVRDITDGTKPGSKIIDIDPDRTAKLIGAAKGKLGEIREVQGKLRGSRKPKRGATTRKG